MKAAQKAPRPALRSGAPPRSPAPEAPLLVLDTGSAVSSLAIGAAGRCLGQRAFPLRQTAEELLPQLRGLLAAAGLSFAELGGVVVLRGPGSFTGLRIGLATALGFHQAFGLPATALGTLPVLAVWALGPTAGAGEPGEPGDVNDTVTVAVDALRGELFAQTFRRGPGPGEPAPQGEARLYTAAELLEAPGRLAGFGLRPLFEKAGAALEADRLGGEPPPLAAEAIPLLPHLAWDPASLIQPIYFRPPAVTLPNS